MVALGIIFCNVWPKKAAAIEEEWHCVLSRDSNGNNFGRCAVIEYHKLVGINDRPRVEAPGAAVELDIRYT